MTQVGKSEFLLFLQKIRILSVESGGSINITAANNNCSQGRLSADL